MSKVKKFLCIVVSFFLIVSFLCIFNFSSDSVEPTQTWNAQQIAEQATLVGCSYEYNERLDAFAYTSVVEISHIFLPHNGSNFNTVVVKLANDIYDTTGKNDIEKEKIENLSPRLYYNSDEYGFFVSGDFCEPYVIKESNTLVFRSENPNPKNAIALNIDSEYVIEEVSVYMIDGDSATLKFSIPSIITFLTVLCILLIFEKKLRYFKTVFHLISKEVTRIKKIAEKSKWLLLIHLLSLMLILILITSLVYVIVLNKYTSSFIFAIFIVTALTMIFVLIDFIFIRQITLPAKLFLTVALIVGTMMCCTSPPITNTTWDDGTHFKNAYSASIIHSDNQSFAQYKLFNLGYSPDTYLDDPSHFVRMMIAESGVDADYPVDYPNLYNIISYSPMIGTLTLISLLGADIAKMIMLCRLATLWSFAYICYRGIRKLSGGALVFSAICLLPGVLYLACSISYDSWLTAWFVYAFASIYAVYQKPNGKFTSSELAKILTALFVACSPKAVYCIMLLPLLFIGKSKFSSPKTAKVFKALTVLTLIVILLILIVPGLFVYDMYSDPRGGENVNSAQQILFILKHPLNFAKMMIQHLGRYISVLIFSSHGISFGYLAGHGTIYDALLCTVALVLLAFSILTDTKDELEYCQSKSFSPVMLVACFVTVVAFSTSIYIAFNNVGAASMKGCQYRYTFPLLPIALFCTRPHRICYPAKKEAVIMTLYSGLSLNVLFGYFCSYICKIFQV